MKSKKQNGKAKVDAVKIEAVKEETAAVATVKNDLKRKSTEAPQAVKPKIKKEEPVSGPLAKSKKRKNRKKKNAAAAAGGATPTKVKEEGAGKEGASIAYLKLWKEDRQNWKFQKIRQIWLYDNMLNNVTLPDDVFPTWLEHMAGSSEKMKKLIIQKASETLKELEAEDSTVDENDVKYQRAKKMIQFLDADVDSDSSS